MPIWQRVFEVEQLTSCNAIVAAGDGLVVTGSCRSAGANRLESFVSKWSEAGEELWRKRMPAFLPTGHVCVAGRIVVVGDAIRPATIDTPERGEPAVLVLDVTGDPAAEPALIGLPPAETGIAWSGVSLRRLIATPTSMLAVGSVSGTRKKTIHWQDEHFRLPIVVELDELDAAGRMRVRTHPPMGKRENYVKCRGTALCTASDGAIVVVGEREAHFTGQELVVHECRRSSAGALEETPGWGATIGALSGGWNAPEGSVRKLHAGSIVALEDRGFVIGGMAELDTRWAGRPVLDANGLLIGLDVHGKKAWDLDLSTQLENRPDQGRGLQGGILDVARLGDGHLAICGRAPTDIQGSSALHVLVAKLAITPGPAGQAPQILWARKLGDEGGYATTGTGIIPAPDGGVYVTGTIDRGSYQQGYLARLGPNGE